MLLSVILVSVTLYVKKGRVEKVVPMEPLLAFSVAGILSVDCHIPEIGFGFSDIFRLNS